MPVAVAIVTVGIVVAVVGGTTQAIGSLFDSKDD